MLTSIILIILTLCSPLLSAQTLDIFFIDVEGGAATLIVTPERQSVLVDTGWRRDDGRDAHRIHRVATDEAGLERIDYLITTHFHRDHYGGVLKLSQLMPIGQFLDSGPRLGLSEDPQFQLLYTEYMRANRGQRRTLNPGERVQLKSGSTPLELRIVASNGETLQGTGAQNQECSALRREKPDLSDNARSVGFLLSFGSFRFLNNGDLTWNIEANLVCPANLIGTVDVYQVTHHGLRSSNNPVLLKSIRPTVAIMNNGAQKGGDPEVVRNLRELSSLKDLFQLHLNLKSRAEENTAPELIANLTPEERCEGNWIKVSVNPRGTAYSVTNSRNGLAREYTVQSRTRN